MSAVCRITFYTLADGAMPAEQLACKLAMKAWVAGHQVHVRTESGQEATALDELMWNIPANRFLPHEPGSEGKGSAVTIDGAGVEIPHDRDLVVNLAASTVTQPERFARLLEIVPAEAGRREASREKFKIYRKQGFSPNHHEITNT